MFKCIKFKLFVLVLFISLECFGSAVVSPFDYDSNTTTFSGGLSSGNFVSSFGGLNPTAGNEFFASGNGNTSTTFYDLGVKMDLGGVIENKTYIISLNVAWYNAGQDGGLSIADFDELYIGSSSGTTNWISTPEPIVEDQWYTWTAEFIPALSDIGKSWEFSALFDIPPLRDIAIDLPSTGFASPKPVPLPASVWLFLSSIISLFSIKNRHLFKVVKSD